jgi:hypothetical protein
MPGSHDLMAVRACTALLTVYTHSEVLVDLGRPYAVCI